MSFGFILDELLDCLPGTDHQAGVLLQELEEESVHVAVGMQRPQGITTFLSIGKTVCVCVCMCECVCVCAQHFISGQGDSRC